MLFDICIQITQIRAKSSVNHVYIIRMELRRPANVPRRATSVSTVYTRVTLKSYGYSRSCRLYRYGLDAEREDQARSVQKVLRLPRPRATGRTPPDSEAVGAYQSLSFHAPPSFCAEYTRGHPRPVPFTCPAPHPRPEENKDGPRTSEGGLGRVGDRNRGKGERMWYERDP